MLMDTDFSHTPVMTKEILHFLGSPVVGIVVDATVGFGGHAKAILSAHPDVLLAGIDRDQGAVSVAAKRLESFGGRAVVLHGRYDEPEIFSQAAAGIRNVAAGRAELPVVAVLFDLGVNSHQLDNSKRGFSYMQEGSLDMRMDTSSGMTATELLQNISLEDLKELLRSNGEGRFASKLAREIISHRPVTSTRQLSEIVEAVIPRSQRRRGHPAKRVFQALRIAVNEELIFLGEAIDRALDIVTPGGRILVLSYHSGEDKIIKSRFRFAADGGCQCPPTLPCRCDAVRRGKIITKSSVKATEEEVINNSRAKSARLRVIEKTEPIYLKELS